MLIIVVYMTMDQKYQLYRITLLVENMILEDFTVGEVVVLYLMIMHLIEVLF